MNVRLPGEGDEARAVLRLDDVGKRRENWKETRAEATVRPFGQSLTEVPAIRPDVENFSM